MDYVLLIIGFILLVLGGEFLVRSSVAISLKMNISKMIVGLTIVSFATSAPELIVSLKAALDEHSDIALGNIIGSNIANIGLILGLVAMIHPIVICRFFKILHWPAMIIMSLLMFLFMQSELVVSRLEGLALFALISLFVFLLIRFRSKDPDADEIDDTLQQISGIKIFFWLTISALSLYFGSEWLVEGAVNIASAHGVSERVISLTVIAVGTSLPELSASVLAALKKEKSISLGNLIGSNIFNIGSVIGLTAMIHPIKVASNQLIDSDIWWMIAISFVVYPLCLLSKKRNIGPIAGFSLLFAYTTYLYFTLF